MIISQEDLYSTIDDDDDDDDDDDGDNDNESNSLTADTEDHNKLNLKSDSYTSYIEHELDLPQFERTIFQHHDIQINVPDSKHSLEATETDMEILKFCNYLNHILLIQLQLHQNLNIQI